MFASLITRTAQDIDILIDSLPSQESTPERQVGQKGQKEQVAIDNFSQLLAFSVCFHIHIAFTFQCALCISENFRNVTFRRTSHSENTIIEHYASLVNFWEAENITNV